MDHDFNGHEVNGILWIYGTKCYNRAFHLVNKLHDFTGIHDLSGNFFSVKLLHDCIRAGIFLSNEQQIDTMSLFDMGLYAISVKKNCQINQRFGVKSTPIA